jgi:hypothetical protein
MRWGKYCGSNQTVESRETANAGCALEEARLWVAKRIDTKITFVLNSYRQFQNAGIITYATLLYFNMIRHYNFIYMHIKVSVTVEVQ